MEFVTVDEYNNFVEKMLGIGICPGFDEQFYTNSYPQVKESNLSPLEHYMTVGWKINMDPSRGFIGASYFAANTDVYNKGANPLIHYLLFGIIEGRSITSSPDRKRAIAAHMQAGKSPPFTE